MDYKVIFRDSFIKDLELIVKSVAIRNPVAAHELGETAIAASEKLRFFPERHPQVVEILLFWDGRQSTNPSFRPD